jgi:glucosylceramidase
MELLAQTVVPGSVRIACTKYCECIDASAWWTPEGQLALLLLNKSEQNAPVTVRLNGLEAAVVLYPRSITAAIIE